MRHSRTALRRRASFGLLAAAPLLVAVVPAYAAAPVPDAGFGTSGLLSVPAHVQLYDALVLAGGDVVTVAGGDDASSATDDPGVITRYTSAGATVATFGSGGTVSIAKAGYSIVFTHVENGPGGTLVAFGSYAKHSAECGGVAARVDATTGTPDPTFGTGGLALVTLGGHLGCAFHGSNGYVGGLSSGTVLPDGRVLLSTLYYPRTDHGRPSRIDPGRPYLAALTPAGAPSTVFGSGGTAIVPVGKLVDAGPPHVAADGALLLGVSVNSGLRIPGVGYPIGSIGAVRLLPAGSLDSSFGGAGVALRRPFGYGSFSGTVDVVTQPGRRILVAGALSSDTIGDEYQDDVGVVRFTSIGGNDGTFARGKGYTRIPTMYVESLARMNDGSVVIAGAQNNGPLFVTEPEVVGRMAHLSADGVADTTWGAGGVRDVKATGAGQSLQAAVGIGTDGSLTFAGRTGTHKDPVTDLATWSGSLMRFTTPAPAAVRGAVEGRLSGAYGGWHSCGTSLVNACTLGTTWYLTGSAWPREAHDPARIVLQVQRFGADKVWRSYPTTSAFVTDDGAFRGTGKLVSVGSYRFRAALPASSTTLLSYGPWSYGHR